MKYLLAAVLVLALGALVYTRLRPADPSANDAGAEIPPGWGSVVLGAPSGAAVPEADAQPETPKPAPDSKPLPPPPPVPEVAREFELSVSPGQTLSVICKEHYGTASVKLVEALARFNGLPNADALRAGAKLRLPPLETLQKP